MIYPSTVPVLVLRLVLAGYASLREIDEHYTLADVVEGNMMLDARDAADAMASAPRAKP